MNVGMTIGVAPITGIPLPFVSVGGSSLIANLTAMGILQAIHVRGRRRRGREQARLHPVRCSRVVREARAGAATGGLIAVDGARGARAAARARASRGR